MVISEQHCPRDVADAAASSMSWAWFTKCDAKRDAKRLTSRLSARIIQPNHCIVIWAQHILRAMIRSSLMLIFMACIPALAQRTSDANYKLALSEHKGQLTWSADGFKIVQSSAKGNGREVGIR